MLPRIFLVLSIYVAVSSTATAQTASDLLRLTLPSRIYAVVDVEMSLYFDNVVLTRSLEAWDFDVECNVGRTEPRRWTLTPAADDVGSHELTVVIRDRDGREVDRKSTRLHVIAPEAGSDQEIRLLIVGDSLTHATAYPNEIARLLSEDGNPDWQMMGTHRPASARQGVAHEGYGGWTWQRFVSKYEAEPDGTHRKRSSPFVFLNDAGKPVLDVTRYFNAQHDGQRPDFVFFLLGINDCFSADPDDAAAIDGRIDTMLTSAETLLTAFHQAAPDADLVVCVTTPPNSREAAFEANYKGRYPRWGWKRIQHRLVERLLDRFEKPRSDQAKPGQATFLVPTHLNLDPLDGYPENNGVHPNTSGYRQIGVSIYSWLKWRLSQQ